MFVQTRGGSFGPGGFGGGIFSGALSGSESMARPVLGLGAEPMVWKGTTSNPAIATLQSQLNGMLRRHGYYQIGVDGKLGPATCGAIGYGNNLPRGFDGQGVSDDLLSQAAPLCKGQTWPTKIGSKTPDKETFEGQETNPLDIPWNTTSLEVGSLQPLLNAQLLAHDYLPIGMTSKLDAPTCGAMRLVDTWGFDYLTLFGKNCAAYQTPAKKAPPKADVPIDIPVTEPPDGGGGGVRPGGAGRKSGLSTASLVGGVLALAAVTAAGVYFGKKQKKVGR
jgi:hypothetical protein